MRTLLIEIPDGYDKCAVITLVGNKYPTTNVFTHSVDLSKGNALFLDKEKLKKGEVFYTQE